LAILLALVLSINIGTIATESYDNVIVVQFSQKYLTVYDGQFVEVASYPVAVPKDSIKIKLPVYGTVVRVDLNPYWYPTKSIREYYRKRNGVILPNVVKPGSKLNAMGKGKIIVKFTGDGITPLSRIHGTYQDQFIGKKVSLGCIRMHNADIKNLIGIIKGKRTLVIYIK
jgi:lipoprotein-anchoring transpeptidase ErfK/SrfK